jgi:hypothetical protein
MADTTTTTYSLVKPEVGASEDTWGAKINTTLDTLDDLLDGTTAIAPNLSALKIAGVTVTTTAAELNYNDITTLGSSEASKVVTTAADGSTTFTGNVTFAETTDTVYNITDGASFEIDPINGNVQTITLGAARAAAATNFASGQSLILGVDDGTAYALTWPTMTWVVSGGGATAPNLAVTGYTWVMLWKQGTTLFGAIVGSL